MARSRGMVRKLAKQAGVTPKEVMEAMHVAERLGMIKIDVAVSGRLTFRQLNSPHWNYLPPDCRPVFEKVFKK